jgi:type II secretory pathway pseudopilin PulG
VTRRRRSRAGFTLVELTIALVAGLIVALGIVGLSREATRTFNEEVRSSAAEAALRSAVDRLRADLARAAYMSTGNILSDPMTAKAPTSPLAFANTAPPGIKQLAALALFDGGSTSNGLPLSALQSPAIAPDVLLIAGNMTCAEQFDVQMIIPPSGSCQQILLSPVSPAIYRVAAAGIATPAGSQALNNVFAPSPDGGTLHQYMVRLLDDTGHTQYLATCLTPPGGQVAGITGGQPYVWIDSTDTPIQTAQSTKGVGGVSGYAAGRAWVNPIQWVRWEITSTTQEQTAMQQFSNGLGGTLASTTVDTNKYDLIRSYADVAGAASGSSTVGLPAIATTSEVVAEYAIDLDFAFTVDTTIAGPTQPNVISFPFEDTRNVTWGATIANLNPPPSTPPTNQGPQRIRLVRSRIVTRAAMPDRSVNIPVTQFPNEEFMYRYCIIPPCTINDTSLKWARARTITAEVSLANNSSSYY